MRYLILICALMMSFATLSNAQGEIQRIRADEGPEIRSHNTRICSYDTYQWNVNQRKAVNFKRVQKPYDELLPHERDKLTGCTICNEDMREIHLLQGDKILIDRVCYVIADDVQSALENAIDQGAIINSITAYRVGQTRGNIDANGNRTQFSNHSFGVAIDINAESNGLYENCFSWSPNCRLRKGGAWHPNNPDSLTKHHPVVQEMENIGLKWGGEIAGKQKDFMHFSPSGY